jgi:acetylornithine/succinyldiaminopimelate/putrescine aminotransferase
VRAPYADLLSAGTHGSTFGGTPLGCAVALKVLEVVQKEGLANNARQLGEYLRDGLRKLSESFPAVLRGVRGLGLMLGMELAPNIPNLPGDPAKPQAIRLAQVLHTAGLLTVPAGGQILRLLPPLNLRRDEADEGLKIIASVAAKLAG